MAEAAAILGLVSSIASLVDISAKVVSRLREFTSKTSDVPESFRALSTRLPLLIISLDQITVRVPTGRLSNDVAEALQAVIHETSTQVSTVQACLSRIMPPENTSKLERALKALKSLVNEDRVNQAVEKTHKDIGFLILHQTSQHIDMGDRILEELSKLNVAPLTVSWSFVACLGQAPQIDANAFTGRKSELQQLRDSLLPIQHPRRQCIINISGMGGVGKTQLSLAHVRDCADEYSSVFWLNAKDENKLETEHCGLGNYDFPQL